MAGNASFNTLATTTFQKYSKKLTDNIFYGTPLFAMMMEGGRKKTEQGGLGYNERLMYGQNTTFKGTSEFGVIDTTPQSGLSVARYTWSQYTGSVIMSELEIAQNRGDSQISSLMQDRANQLEMSAKEKLNIDLFGSANGSDTALNGLQTFVSVTPTTGTVGGIDRSDSSNSWWRNNATTSAGSFAATGLDKMRTMYNNCSQDGSDAPDVIITTQTVFEAYEKTGQGIQRTTNQKMLDLGFQNFEYKGATFFYDSQCTSGYMYMLNTDYLGLRWQSGYELGISPFVKPFDQPVRAANVISILQFTMSNAAKQGVISGLSA